MEVETKSAQAAMMRGVIGGSVLVLFTLLAVFASRLEGTEPGAAEAVPVAQLALRVEDQADGSIALRNAADGSLVGRVGPGEENFMRIAFRGLAQARRHAGFGREIPFQLSRFEDGRLVLADATTGRRVPVDAFGKANAQGFARLLPQAALPQTETP